MFSAFLIALREGLEATLIVSILVTIITKTNRKNLLPKMWIGIAIAIIIPTSLGAYLVFGNYELDFKAQENLEGILSLIAVIMVTYMLFWMAKHSKNMGKNLQDEITKIEKSNYSGFGIIALAVISVGREGLESAIMLWGVVSSVNNTAAWKSTLAIILGFATAVLLGFLLYKGILKINLAKFFRITGYFLILIAAGIISYGIGDLQEAGTLPGLTDYMYNLENYMPGSTNFMGRSLLEIYSSVVNLPLKPTRFQFIGWISYLVIVSTFYYLFYSSKNVSKPLINKVKLNRGTK